MNRRKRQQAEISRLGRMVQTNVGEPGTKAPRKGLQRIVRGLIESGEIAEEIAVLGGTTVCRLEIGDEPFYGLAHVSHPDENIMEKGIKIATGRAINNIAKAALKDPHFQGFGDLI